MYLKNFSPVLLFFLIALFSIPVVGQDFKWAGQIKGSQYDYDDFANKMELDSEGNSYIFGETESFLFDIDPTPNGVEIIDNSNFQNFRGLYLIKMDKDGKYIWGKTFGDYKRGGEYSYGLKLDKDGNINLLATISELDIAQSIVNGYMSIIKLKPNGDLISTKKIPTNFPSGGSIRPFSFDMDNQNNVFITGYFIGNISLDASNPALNLTATGIDNFILKINNTGNIEWIKTFYNEPGNIANSKVLIGKDGNIILLNGGSLYKINTSSQSIIWERKFTEQSIDAYQLTENNIILMNHKDSSLAVDVDPSPTNTVEVFANNFVIFLNLDGDFVDVKRFPKPFNGYITFNTIAEDYNGNLIFVGSFKDTADFDPSASTFNLTAAGEYGEGFYLKLDANRNFVNAFKIGHETPQLNPYNNCYWFEIKNIKLRNSETYLSGDFMWACDLDPSLTKQYTLTTINSSTVNRDGFIIKLASCETGKPNEDPDQYFCSVESKISDLKPNSDDIKWYDSLTSTSPLSKTTVLADGKTYFASQQNENCPESIERLVVTAHFNIVPTSPSVINSDFCKNKNASLGDIEMSGQNIKWYDTSFSAAVLPTTTLLEDNRTYYASQTSGCESDRTPVLVRIYDTPLPTGNNNHQFCFDEIKTLENLGISGTDIKWYDSALNGNILPETTLLQNGVYYASQTLNNCESERFAVTIQILGETDSHCIKNENEFQFPKFFTPNNDGHTDTWTIDAAYLAPNTGIKIFDRYGKFIKELGPNTAWDGTYLGHQEPSSDYWFTITRLNGTEFRGHFTLKR